MALFRVGALPARALAASAAFHGEILPQVLALLADRPTLLTLVFAPAGDAADDHAHAGWRLAVVQDLAREHAPVRVNALVSDDETAIATALAYVETAHGLTGQVMALDGNGAE